MKLNQYSTGALADRSGRMYTRRPVSLIASAAFTTTTTSTAIELGDAAMMNLELVCTAASGTSPTNTVKVQGSNDGTNWYDIASFTQLTGTGTQRLPVLAARFVRAVQTIGGTTPSFTLSLTGEAV